MESEHKAWAMQWKAAGPRLQEIRDRELRELLPELESPKETIPERNGLVQFQRWMMRKAILDSLT